MKSIKLYLILLCCALMCACNDDEATDVSTGITQEVDPFKVAVIVPGELLPYWQRTAEWAKEIMHWAQKGTERRVEVELEFYDEKAADIDAYINNVAESEEYAALIGPVSPEKATVAARACRTLKKTHILPITANAEFQRIFSTLDHVFNLTQNDIMQVETMFASQRGITIQGFDDEVGLIVSNDIYGETFYNWFGFLATERDLNASFVCQLDEEISAVDAIHLHNEYNESNIGVLERMFFASSNPKDLIEAWEEVQSLSKDNPDLYFPPQFFCADACVTQEVAEKVKNGIEGVEPTANPSSGFIPAYQAKFGEHPRRGEAQLFDAVYLVYYSLKAMLMDGRQLVEDKTDDYGTAVRHSPLCEYFMKVTDADLGYEYGWFEADAMAVFNNLEAGFIPAVTGASSTLDFDPKHHCAVTSTTYRHWKLNDGQFVTLQYFTADGSDRTISTLNDWTFKVGDQQELEEYTSNHVYPEHKDNYAVIVAGSTGWSNYRHQADALAMYHALKKQGFQDDHIILIMEDDIAHHEKNIHPGEMRVTPNGENLYTGIKADYKLTSLYPADIVNILTGEKTNRTPTVLEATKNDNVFFFWSGHGVPDALMHDEIEFTSAEVRRMLETMRDKEKYRKLFFVMETCFSGSVAEACEGIEGVLMMTAANDSETSKADIYDSDLGVYLSNGFTRAFQDKIQKDPNVILRDLFYHVVGQTAGSHASLFNYKNYGNIYTERLGEMVTAK